MSLLPVELHIYILKQLSGRELTSVKTIVSYLSANSVTRAAALDKSVWEHLYRSHYVSSEVSPKETERRARLKTDWRMMYIERHTIDRTALQLLDHIRAHPEDLKASAGRFALECACDAWDALQIEAELPIPRCFRDPTVDDMNVDPVPEALPRSFWAKAALGALCRLQSIQTWYGMSHESDPSAFEELLIGLSAFADVPASQVSL